MHKLGNSSNKKLNTCHQDIQMIVRTAIALSVIDFGIAEGERSVEKQQLYFKAGKSKVDGINIKGKHNYSPSLAFDIYIFLNGKASWDFNHLCYVAGVLTTVSQQLYEQGKISHLLRWGGNWDKDGEIVSDQSFDDLPHFELYQPI